MLPPLQHTAFKLVAFYPKGAQLAYHGRAAVGTKADAEYRFVRFTDERYEAFQWGKRHVDRARDMAEPPFGAGADINEYKVLADVAGNAGQMCRVYGGYMANR